MLGCSVLCCGVSNNHRGRGYPMDCIIYTRVSTQEQGQERNGLEAQLKACLDFCNREGLTPLLHLEEVASGGLGLEGRPMLAKAFEWARKRKAFVLVSKLDRLSREVVLIASLMSQGVRFVTVEDGLEAEPFLLHMKAVVGEHERKTIGRRTRDALAAKKARGEALGRACHKDPELALALAIERSTAANRASAEAFARQVGPMVKGLVSSGLTYAQVAERLNASGTPTARGGAWHASTVCTLLKRLPR